MEQSIYNISLIDLLWVMIPVSMVMGIYIKWSGDKLTMIYAIVRMMIQLLLIGYVLIYIFDSNSSYMTIFVLSVMLIAASFISLRPLKSKGNRIYLYAFVSISVGSLFTLIIVSIGVLNISVLQEPRIVIPIAGMIFANAMNAVSIAAERFESEIENNPYIKSREIAYKAALIPIINSFFAVGLVSLPGMMTGQILSGIDPLIAVRYQMLVMLMVLGSAGISVAMYLYFLGETGAHK